MIRRAIRPVRVACSLAALGGRSPAQAGSRCLNENESGGQFYCRQAGTA
jgi:hypothetical protein